MTYPAWMAVGPIVDIRRFRPRCPLRTPLWGEPCGRLPGHTTECRPARVVESDLRRRAERYQEKKAG